MTRSRTWVLGTVVLVVAILAAGFFLLISPKRSQAADLKAQQVSQDATNADLQAKINTLKAQEKDLPAQQAKLAEFRQQIPSTPNLPSMIRTLTQAAKDSGTTLVTVTPANPTNLTAPAATGPVTPGAPAVVTATVQQIPLKIAVIGAYSDLIQFLGEVEELKRVMLNTEFTVGKPDITGYAGQEVDVTRDHGMVITSGMFMVNEAAAAPAQTVTPSGTTATPGTAPAPTTDSAAAAAPAQ